MMTATDKRIEELLSDFGETISDINKDFSPEFEEKVNNGIFEDSNSRGYIKYLAAIIDRLEIALTNAQVHKDDMNDLVEEYRQRIDRLADTLCAIIV